MSGIYTLILLIMISILYHCLLAQDTSMDEDTISDIDSRSIEKMDKGLFQLEDVAYSKTSNGLNIQYI